jgi:hypothetical protein
MRDVRTPGVQVRSVLGYCVGGVFAAKLAECVAAWQGTPPQVILFDPERPHKALLHRHYGDAINVISAHMSPAEAGEARRAGEEAMRQTDDLDKIAETLGKLVAELGGPVFERVGLDARRRAELTGTFSSFLSYLVAAAELDPSRVWANAAAISSATLHNGLNSLPPQQRAGVVEKEIRFDLEHAGLLRNERVAQAVKELLK